MLNIKQSLKNVVLLNKSMDACEMEYVKTKNSHTHLNLLNHEKQCIKTAEAVSRYILLCIHGALSVHLLCINCTVSAQ